MKWCDLWDDWGRQLRTEAHGDDCSYHKQARKKDWKEERKKRREKGTQPAALDWKCEEPLMKMYAFCDKAFQKQEIITHTRYCQANTNKKMSRPK